MPNTNREIEMTFLRKYIIILLSIITIIILTICKILYNFDLYSDSILVVTALIILWYTFETSEIRKSESIIAKANEENQKRFRSPIVICKIYTNENDPLDTRVRLSNLSNYPVAVRLNCNIKIENEVLKDFSPAYDGRHYWNLQYGQLKEGHFTWFDLLRTKKLISEDEFKEIKKDSIPDKLKKSIEIVANQFDLNPPKITMDIEVYCENEMGLNTYYPPVHHDYDFSRKIWIPILTSEKPYWEYNSKPAWIRK